MVKRASPSSPGWRDCAWAFGVGGGICALGEALRQLFLLWYDAALAGTLTSVSLIFLSAAVTLPGWYQKLAAHAGAGTLVPITGFANAVASPAIDARSEGLILGVGAKIFTVAGPVLLYGTLAGAFCGVIFWIIGLCTA